MRRLWLVFSLAPVAASPDPWFAPDKVQHFLSSAFVQSMSYGMLRTTGLSHRTSLTGAWLTTLTVGAGKEVHDLRVGGDFSLRDFTWDVAGGAAASVLLVRTQR